MTVIRRSKWGVPYSQFWFARTFSWLDGWGLTVYKQFLGQSVPRFPFIKDEHYTILIDLTQNEEALVAGMNKNTRTQLKKAEGDGFVWSYETNLESFRTFFNAFAKEKGLKSLESDVLQSEKDALSIGKVEWQGRVLAAHAYLVDRKECRARFLYGASARLEDGVEPNLAGRANRLAHFSEIQDFKRQGLKAFDFGGYAKDTSDLQKQGINQFKESFGGVVVEESNYDSVWVALAKLFQGKFR
ncbi:MAG: hypothetical protein HKM06_05300 [Spirochaetales bacterium]|nr:hypothetical protein [Spirochaetales bacterium]